MTKIMRIVLPPVAWEEFLDLIDEYDFKDEVFGLMKDSIVKKKLSINDIIPFMKPGWVAMDEDGPWTWFESKPVKDGRQWIPTKDNSAICEFYAFDIELAQDWKKSLRRIKNE